MKEKIINKLIKWLKADTNKISDGFHSFEQLYDHRIALFIALCRAASSRAWKSKNHSDGTRWDGWFIMGLGQRPGKQITYHLPESYWDQLEDIPEWDAAPNFDGHTPDDVIKRLLKLKI